MIANMKVCKTICEKADISEKELDRLLDARTMIEV